MKINIILFLLIIFLVSCDANGILTLYNGYPFEIRAEIIFDYQGSVFTKSVIFENNKLFAPDAMGNEQNSHIIAIKLFTMEGDLLAEYPVEYIKKIRDAYKKEDRYEEWTFTEKGLFLTTIEILKKYKRDSGEILKYYRSDEAQSDLEKILNR
jgi:hypothetical protein